MTRLVIFCPNLFWSLDLVARLNSPYLNLLLGCRYIDWDFIVTITPLFLVKSFCFVDHLEWINYAFKNMSIPLYPYPIMHPKGGIVMSLLSHSLFLDWVMVINFRRSLSSHLFSWTISNKTIIQGFWSYNFSYVYHTTISLLGIFLPFNAYDHHLTIFNIMSFFKFNFSQLT